MWEVRSGTASMSWWRSEQSSPLILASIGWPALQIKCERIMELPDVVSCSVVLGSLLIILMRVLLPDPGFPDIQNRDCSGVESQAQNRAAIWLTRRFNATSSSRSSPSPSASGGSKIQLNVLEWGLAIWFRRAFMDGNLRLPRSFSC